MINLAYVYKDEDKAVEIRDEFMRLYRNFKNGSWGEHDKHINYENVRITFIDYKTITNDRGYKFYEIYIQPELAKDLTYEQLSRISYSKCDCHLPREFTRMTIGDALS